jgi:hypothetical protein
VALLFGLAACSYGQPIDEAAPASPGYPSAATFRHLKIGECPWLGADASATVIAPAWMVTNEHAAIALPSGRHYVSPDFDLAFARITGGDPLPLGVAHNGDKVWVYGVGCGTGRRFAEGKVVAADAKHCWGKPTGRVAVDDVDRFCANDGMGTAPGFIFAADIGPGFSGGPVVNEKGQLVGVVQGTMDRHIGDLPHGTLGFAYHISDVLLAGWPVIVAQNRVAVTNGASAATP